MYFTNNSPIFLDKDDFSYRLSLWKLLFGTACGKCNSNLYLEVEKLPLPSSKKLLKLLQKTDHTVLRASNLFSVYVVFDIT